MTNRTILQGLKTCLTQAKSFWIDDLYNVLWAYRTTSHALTEETPFKLAFDTEAIIPFDIGLPSLHAKSYIQHDNEVMLRVNLDFLEGSRKQALLRMAACQQRIAHYYNSWVKNKLFKTGDLVM